MNTTTNTVLITGGSAGIGFAIAKLLTEKGNQVIITGRNKERLEKAAAQLKNVTAIVSDVSKENDVDELAATLQKDFPQLNMVINNAGRAFLYSLEEEKIGAYDKAAEEMNTNYIAVIRLTEKLLPLLKKQASAAIVNVTSVAAFVPTKVLATYSASKAALHSYSQALRGTLEKTSPVKVFELMPPLVDTEFSQGLNGKGIPASQVAEEFYDALQKDEYEIHVGNTADVYKLFISAPADAFQVMNAF